MSNRHSPATIEAVASMRQNGMSYGQIALKLNLTIGQVAGIVNRHILGAGEGQSSERS